MQLLDNKDKKYQLKISIILLLGFLWILFKEIDLEIGQFISYVYGFIIYNDRIGSVRACQKCTEVHFYFMYIRFVLKFVDS